MGLTFNLVPCKWCPTEDLNQRSQIIMQFQGRRTLLTHNESPVKELNTSRPLRRLTRSSPLNPVISCSRTLSPARTRLLVIMLPQFRKNKYLAEINLNKNALTAVVSLACLEIRSRNKEAFNSTRNRIYSLKVFYFLLYRRRYFIFVSDLIYSPSAKGVVWLT